MADMKLKITADLDQLRKDIRKAMRERFSVKADVEGGPAEKRAGRATRGGVAKDKAGFAGLAKSLARLVPLVGIIAAVAQAIKPLIDIVQAAVNLTVFYLFKLIKWLFGGGLSGALQTVWQNITAWIKNLWETLTSLLPQVWERIGEWIRALWETVKEKLTETWTKITDWLKRLWEGLRERLSEVWSRIVEGLRNAWDRIKQALETVRAAVQEKLSELKEKLQERFATLYTRVKEVWDKITTTVKTLQASLQERLNAVRTSITSGVANIVSWLKSLPGKIASSIRSSIKSLLPSRQSDDKIGDGIVQSGRVVATDPRDTIIAARDLSGMMGGSITINIKGENPSEIASRVKEELARERFRASRF